MNREMLRRVGTGAVGNRTYQGRKRLLIFRIHHKSPNPLNPTPDKSPDRIGAGPMNPRYIGTGGTPTSPR